MRRKKILLIIIALALLMAGLVLLLLRGRRNYLELASVAGQPDGAFVVQVERPILSGRAPWEIPRAILGSGDREHRFGNMSPGAKVAAVGPTHLELSADGGWDLVIESNGQGRVVEGTHLVFVLRLFDRSLKLNCRPAEPAPGHFNTSARGNMLDGDFILYLPQCKNAESGKNTAGLPTFTVRGSFKGLQPATVNDSESKK